MMHVKPIYSEHMDVELEYPTLTKLRGNSRKPSVEGKWLATTTESENAYVVAKIQYLSKPFAQADVSEDQTTGYVCGCDGHYFHYAKNSIEPEGECKHVQAVRRKNRETKPEGQATL